MFGFLMTLTHFQGQRKEMEMWVWFSYDLDPFLRSQVTDGDIGTMNIHYFCGNC